MKFEALVRKVKAALNAAGATPPLDEKNPNFGPKSEAISDQFEIEVTARRVKPAAPKDRIPTDDTPHELNPGYVEHKKHLGKGEHDKTWRGWLAARWRSVTRLALTTIVGASAAWCGLYIGANQQDANLPVVSGAAAAKSWRNYGQKIDWQKDGLPESAIVHLNHKGKCDSGSNNHVTYAAGDCTVEDLKRLGQWPGEGGNQGNMVKRSMYPTGTICAVRWPPGMQLPPKITKSRNCSGKATDGESTR